MTNEFKDNNLKNKSNFDQVITSNDFKFFDFLNLSQYLNLILLLVKRNFVVFYKQTILGPIWHIL